MTTSKRKPVRIRAASRKRGAAFETLLSGERLVAEKIDVIRRGVRARVVNDMVDYLSVPKSVILGILRTPESTAHRLIKGNSARFGCIGASPAGGRDHTDGGRDFRGAGSGSALTEDPQSVAAERDAVVAQLGELVADALQPLCHRLEDPS